VLEGRVDLLREEPYPVMNRPGFAGGHLV
jgi:hypothetical protein